jgi:S-DNA-T family DNA segregation ATPase FtsK/SpoIIIE
MREHRPRSNDPRRNGVRGDDPPTEPIPVVPAQLNPPVPAAPVGPAGPVHEGVILSDLESEYIDRHFDYQRKATGQRTAVEVRRPAPVVRLPRPAPVLRKAALAVRRGTGRATVYLVTTARVAATHERTRTTLRWAIRNGIVYTATGLWVVARRVWEAHTQSRYERMMRQAEFAGDLQRLIDWEQRAERARALRHKRRMDWIAAPFALAKAVAVSAATVAGMLLALGITLAVGYRDIAWVLAPLQAAVDLIAWVVWLITVAWFPLVLAAPWLALAALWQLGRTHGTVPAWAAPSHAREQEGVHPGRDRDRAGPPGWDRQTHRGGQEGVGSRVPDPAGAGEQLRLSRGVLAALGCHPDDDCRSACRAGPQPEPGAAGGVAGCRRTRPLRRFVGGRPRVDGEARPALPAAE